jgi:predicted  nucleic acid-binding Zn-ribbon protein
LIQSQELLAETRASKKSTDEELSRTLVEIENLKSNAKKFESEFNDNKQKLSKTLKEIEENRVIISSMKNQINETNEKLKAAHLESETIKCKIGENEKLLNLKDDEISSLKVLLEEERKVQSKYANSYDQCRKQLLESQQLIKQTQTESDLLRKKVYSCNEELRTSRSNLSPNDEINKSKEYEKLKNECLSLQSKLHSVESELFSYRDSNNKLVSDYESLQNSFELLQKLNHELESRGDNYWREQFNRAKSDADDAHSQVCYFLVFNLI